MTARIDYDGSCSGCGSGETEAPLEQVLEKPLAEWQRHEAAWHAHAALAEARRPRATAEREDMELHIATIAEPTTTELVAQFIDAERTESGLDLTSMQRAMEIDHALTTITMSDVEVEVLESTFTSALGAALQGVTGGTAWASQRQHMVAGDSHASEMAVDDGADVITLQDNDEDLVYPPG